VVAKAVNKLPAFKEIRTFSIVFITTSQWLLPLNI
jgi:hypothetical protein